MKIVFNMSKEDDARNPGVIADCTGDNAGDSVSPELRGRLRDLRRHGRGADHVHPAGGAGRRPAQVKLLVWIFVMRVMMIIASGGSYLLNEAIAKARYGSATKMNFEAPLTSLVWLTSACVGRPHLHRVAC